MHSNYVMRTQKTQENIKPQIQEPFRVWMGWPPRKPRYRPPTDFWLKLSLVLRSALRRNGKVFKSFTQPTRRNWIKAENKGAGLT